ncbi:MAG: hypothetical protein AABX05_04585, partial [Nanoarchaeota archaeon]
MFIAKGIKAWIVALLAIAGIILLLVLIFNLILLLLPAIIIFVLIGYVLKYLNDLKKQKVVRIK